MHYPGLSSTILDMFKFEQRGPWKNIYQRGIKKSSSLYSIVQTFCSVDFGANLNLWS